MKPLVVIVFTAFLLCTNACMRGPARVTTPRPNPTATLTAQAGKDDRIVSAANAIDIEVKGTPQEPAVVALTTEQREAVKAAPAADVAALIRSYELALNAAETRAATAEKRAKAAEDFALKEQVKYLNWAGFGFLAAFGVSVVFGQLAAALRTWPLLVLGAGCFGLAQVIGSPWFLRGFIGLLVVATAYAAFYVYNRHKEGVLRQSLEKKAAVLKQIVPVLDDAYEKAEESVKAVLDTKIFDRLSTVFNRSEKAVVHEIRAELPAKA